MEFTIAAIALRSLRLQGAFDAGVWRYSLGLTLVPQKLDAGKYVDLNSTERLLLDTVLGFVDGPSTVLEFPAGEDDASPGIADVAAQVQAWLGGQVTTYNTQWAGKTFTAGEVQA